MLSESDTVGEWVRGEWVRVRMGVSVGESESEGGSECG